MVPQVTDRDRNGGRGGRGRSLPPTGGRGAGGAARGDKGAGRGATTGPGGAPAGGAPPAGGRGTSVSRSTNERPTNGEQTPSPPPSHASRQSDHHRESEPSKGKSSAPPPPAKNVVTGPSANTPWGTGGMNLAEKLKLAELQKNLPPPPAPVVVPADQNEPPRDNTDAGDDKGNRSRRSRGRGAGPPGVGTTGEKKKDGDVTASDGSDGLVEAMVDMTIKKEESITPAMSFPVPQPAPVGMNHASANVASPDRTSSVAQQQQQQQQQQKQQQQQQQQQASPSKQLFKMGKFEPPMGSEVTTNFQFGSFGQFGGSTDELQAAVAVPSSSSSSSSAWASVIGSSTGGSSAGPEKASEEQKSNQPSNNTDVQTSVGSLSSAGGVWGNNGASNAPGGTTGGAGADTMSSLFPDSAKGLLSGTTNAAVNSSSSSQQQTSRYEQKPSAPPGWYPCQLSLFTSSYFSQIHPIESLHPF